MRTDIDPPVYGDISEETASTCKALNCQLLGNVTRVQPNIPTCAVDVHKEYTVKLESIAVEDYKSKIPVGCPLHQVVNPVQE